MKFRSQEILEWLRHFIDICQKNNLWYTADRLTLLGSFRHGGLVPWHKKAEVMMTEESYSELRRLFPHNVIDSAIDSSYKSLLPSFVFERSKWMDEKPFIEIRIVIPSTLAKIKKFNSKLSNTVDKLKFKKTNIKNAINALIDTQYQGYCWITSRPTDLQLSWYSIFTFDVKQRNFSSLKINVPAKAEELLTQWYGDKYMACEAPETFYEFPAPTNHVFVNLKKEREF